MEYVTLNNGIKMPYLGFGVFQVRDAKKCEMHLGCYRCSISIYQGFLILPE